MSDLSYPLRPACRATDGKLSSVLRALMEDPRERISLADLIALLGDRSFVPLMIVFSLPNLFFFVPGASVVTGPPLMFVAAQLLLGRKAVWLPRGIGARSIDQESFRRIVARCVVWIERVERLARPRFWGLPEGWADRLVGGASLVMAVFVFLPIPFANALPALSVIMLALSLSERDGIWLWAGILLGLASIGLVGAVFAAGALTMFAVF